MGLLALDVNLSLQDFVAFTFDYRRHRQSRPCFLLLALPPALSLCTGSTVAVLFPPLARSLCYTSRP